MESVLSRKRQNVIIRLWFEVGHRCDNTRMSKSLSGRALSFDWRVWVRSSNGQDMSSFIDKVVFNFHPSSVYTYPTRILPVPPYEVKESSFTSINVSSVIYIKTRPGTVKQMEVKYNVCFKNHKQRMTHSKLVHHDFVNPSDELKRCLLMCGGKEMVCTGVLSPPARPLIPLKMNRHKTSFQFVKPVNWKDDMKMNTQIISGTPYVDFSHLFKGQSMADSETELLSKLYLSQNCYEKQSDANIVLPPMTDPIYQLPELPVSLLECCSQPKIFDI